MMSRLSCHMLSHDRHVLHHLTRSTWASSFPCDVVVAVSQGEHATAPRGGNLPGSQSAGNSRRAVRSLIEVSKSLNASPSVEKENQKFQKWRGGNRYSGPGEG